MTLIAAVIVLLPLLVAAVVCGIARRERLRLPSAPLLRLGAGTIAALAITLAFPRLLAAVGMFAVLFVALAIPVMRALEKTANDRLPHDDVRTASLVPREISMYVPLSARAPTMAAALVLIAWIVLRVSTMSGPRFMLFGFSLAGVTFFGLYEAWMRQEISSVRARDEADRRRRVRAVFGAQTTLVLSFLTMAALSMGSWPGLPALGVAATVIGGTGCAFALSTGIQERYLQAWSARH